MRVWGLLAVFLFSGPGAVRAEEEDAVAESTATAKSDAPKTVDEIYRGAKYRTPFDEPSSSGGGSSGGAAAAVLRDWDPADFDIHELDLKGILQDKKGAFAVLKDRETGMGFILRDKKLFDFKNKRIAGVTGKIDVVKKTVYLITEEKDVQTLRLGKNDEEEDDEDDDEPASRGKGFAGF